MRYARKAIIVLFALLPILSAALGFFGFAANHPVPDSLCVEHSINNGVVTLKFSLSQRVNDTSAIFTVSFDSSALEYISCESLGDGICGKTLGENSVSFSVITALDYLDAGELFTADFLIVDNSERGFVFGIHQIEPAISLDRTYYVSTPVLVSKSLNRISALDVLSFSVNPNNISVTVTNCNNLASGKLVVPDYYNGLPVTVIADDAFSDCSEITELDLPRFLKVIGARSFSYCTSLKKVRMPSAVASIGVGAFEFCTALTDISLPKLSVLPDSAFSYCSSLASITIPDTIESIGENCFLGCSALKNAIIPESVSELPTGTFSGCIALSEVVLGNGVNRVGDKAFESCFSLRNIYIPMSVTEFGIDCFSQRTAIGSVAGSAAHSYALNNSLDFLSTPFDMRGISRVDFDNSIIFSPLKRNGTATKLFAGASETEFRAVASPPFTAFGTGAVAAAFEGSQLTHSYTLVVEGDINGDSIVDARDIMLCELSICSHAELDKYQKLAVDTNRDGDIDSEDFSRLISAALLS